MNIAVFGTGIVGQVIASRLAEQGHQVVVATRDVNATLTRENNDHYGNPPFKVWFDQHKSSIKLATYSDAAMLSAVIVNCTSGQGSISALEQAGKDNLSKKIIIDIANPLDFSNGGLPTLTPGNTDSLGELIQRTFPETFVVKTLNTMNCYLMVDPSKVPGDHNVFMSGNDPNAKATVRSILHSFGWAERNIIDLGDISTSRGTEQLLPIWIRLYGALKTPMFNFHIVKD